MHEGKRKEKNTKKNLHFDFRLQLLHLSSIFKTWNNNLCDQDSWFDPTVKIVCGVGSAHHRVHTYYEVQMLRIGLHNPHTLDMKVLISLSASSTLCVLGMKRTANRIEMSMQVAPILSSTCYGQKLCVMWQPVNKDTDNKHSYWSKFLHPSMQRTSLLRWAKRLSLLLNLHMTNLCSWIVLRMY